MNTLIHNVMAVLPDGMRKTDIAIENGLFSEPEKKTYDQEIEGRELIAVPGFIDTHIHGYGGYGSEDSSPDAVLAMSEALLREGVTAFFPTVYTDRRERMLSSIRAIAEAAGKEKGAEIAGIHVEGPFISPKRIGAQNPEGRLDPDPEAMKEIIEAGKGLVRAMTIAPELNGVAEIADIARKENIVLLMGHTDASYQEALSGMDMGIRHATHLFNAMSGLNHRNPGVAGCALFHEVMNAEIIADGIHVNKDLVRFVLKTKGRKTVLITDSLRPTGQETGPFTANGNAVMMKDGAWVSAENPSLLEGSALTMHKAFRNVISWGISIEDASACCSFSPAAVYGMKDRGCIEYGRIADLVLMNSDLSVRYVFHKGEAYVV